MRILHVDKMLFAPSGVASFVRRLAQLQREAGHEVRYFTCRPQGPSPAGYATRGLPAWLDADGDGDGDENLFPPYVDFRARRRPWDLWRMIHNAQAARLMGRFLDRHKIDVAHVHNAYHHLTPSVLGVLRRRGVPVVMTLHDYRLACPTRHFLRSDGRCTRCLPNRLHHAASPACAGWTGAALAIETAAQRWLGGYRRNVGLFLCPTQYMQQVIRRLGEPACRVVVVRNVVDDVAPLPPCPTDCDSLLFAGRLSHEKGPDLMLELARRLDWAQVVIAGDGPCAAGLRHRVRKEKLSNVVLAGQLDQAQLRRYLERSAALVLPSRAMENSPQIMLEAMLAGRCVIVPDQPPLREWVQDAQTGRLFAPGDADSLTGVAQDVLADVARREAMCRQARQLVLGRHDPAALVSQLESHYRRAGELCASR